MSAFTVTAINGEVQKDDYGNVSAFVNLEGVDGGVLLKKRPPFPEVGETLDSAYTVEDVPKKSGTGTYKKLVRPKPDGGRGGGGGSRDLSPEAQKRIDATGRAQGRAHAQEMALRWAALMNDPSLRSPDELRGTIDWFFNDAQAAKAEGYTTSPDHTLSGEPGGGGALASEAPLPGLISDERVTQLAALFKGSDMTPKDLNLALLAVGIEAGSVKAGLAQLTDDLADHLEGELKRRATVNA